MDHRHNSLLGLLDSFVFMERKTSETQVVLYLCSIYRTLHIVVNKLSEDCNMELSVDTR